LIRASFPPTQHEQVEAAPREEELMCRVHDLLPAEIPYVQVRLFAGTGQTHIPAGDLDALSLFLLAKCVVNQPVDQRCFTHSAASDQNQFGFEQRTFGPEVVIENVRRIYTLYFADSQDLIPWPQDFLWDA